MTNRYTKGLAGLAGLAALALGGSAIAGAATTSTTQSANGQSQTPPAFAGPAHGTAAHENAEKAVTGESATKAQTAAVASVGGGTAGAVTTDYTGGGYEVTVAKSDGTAVEVHLDRAFKAMQGPGGNHPGGDHPAGSAGR